MVQLGWMSDAHVNTDFPEDIPDQPQALGAGRRMTEDIVSLFEDYGVQDLHFNGDMVAPNDGFYSDNGNPHAKYDYYEKFWDLVDRSGYGDRVMCGPGNHECPIQYYIESDTRAKLRYKVEYDGVTVLMMNTAGPAWVSGGYGAAYGWNSGYVPYRDMKWMQRELNEAGDNAKVVFFHHHAWPTPGDPVASVPEGTETMNNLYEVCRNYEALHQILSAQDKIVVPQGHTFQFEAEGSSNVDGVEYLYKKHYYNLPEDALTTYGYIDVDSNGCTVKTIEHGTKEETVILDTEF